MSERMKHYRSGPNDDTEIYCLSDITATFPLPAPVILPTVGTADWPVIRERYPESFVNKDGLIVQVTCYLIRQGGRTILVDTGLGQTFTGPTGEVEHGQLLEQLQHIGVAPTAIDIVFHTHLHRDHVGWNMSDQGAGWQPTFPNARHLAPRLDWLRYEPLLATQDEGADHLRLQLIPLQAQGMLTLVEGEVALTETIYAFPSPGHSPGHMSVQVSSSGDAKYLIAGDAFFHPLQLATPTHHTAIDATNDAAQANATRTELVARIERENLLVSACHFTVAGFGRVVDGGQGRYWQAAA
jgi:glyoxylase-like metal-dependent hydrolase (beta-lactamase superfamily II)